MRLSHQKAHITCGVTKTIYEESVQGAGQMVAIVDNGSSNHFTIRVIMRIAKVEDAIFDITQKLMLKFTNYIVSQW